MKKVLPIFVFCAAIFFFYSPFVAAQNRITSTTVEDDTEEPIKKKCEIVQEFVDDESKNLDIVYTTHSGKYQEMLVKLGSFIQKAEILGYDVEDLYGNFEEMNSLVGKYDQQYTKLSSVYPSLRSYACNTYYSAYYKTLLSTQKQNLAGIRETVVKIKDLYLDEIRSNVLGIKKLTTEVDN